MFSYCFINVMEKKIQSLESRNNQADWEGACAVGQRHRSVALSKPTYVGAPVRSPVSVPGSGSGRTLEGEQSMAGHHPHLARILL